MESLIDKILLTAASLIVFLVEPANALNVGLLLGSLTVSVIVELLPERCGVAILAICIVAACIFPVASLFFAPITYACTRMRLKILRVVWVFAPCAAFFSFSLESWAIAVLLSLVAFSLALRCNTLLNERRQYRILRDGLREQSILLEARNKLLSEKMGEFIESTDAQNRRGSLVMTSSPESQLSLCLSSLTERELEIVAYVAQGLDNREIAARVYASEGTVRNHISSILQKAGLRNRTQLAVAYLCSLEA